jgi:uncharacterized membrane protein HdeD (DUF308 family)
VERLFQDDCDSDRLAASTLRRNAAAKAEFPRCHERHNRKDRGFAVDIELEEREVAEGAARLWWLFLLTGIAWLVFALAVFQWDFTTVYAISYLFGFVALLAGVNEFMSMGVWTTGWKIAHGFLGALFVIAGIWAIVHPHNAFSTLAALVGFFLLFKGIFDVITAFATKAVVDLWWITLVVGVLEILLAFWVAGDFRAKAILLVIYVGIIALSRGITEIILAFKLKGLKARGV